MPNINITINLKGNLFEGNPSAVVGALFLAAKEDVAQEAVDLMHIYLEQVLQNPTGYYESRIQSSRVQDDFVIHDNNVVYGGWLEGVSSRNLISTFKGYHHFRAVARDIRKVAADIVEQKTLPRFIDRLN